jgi:(+)-pinoresinol hydroxylase
MRSASLVIMLLLQCAAFAADRPSAEQGRVAYQKWCTPCHGTGLGKPGTAAATAHGVKTPVLEQRQDLTQKMIESAVRKGTDIMPRFRKTEITDADLAAIVAYLVRK